MNAKIYASLFRWQDTLIVVALLLSCSLIGFLISFSHAAVLSILSVVLFPAAGLGALLVEIGTRPLQRLPIVLLPVVQSTLFRWNARLILAVALVWAVVIHRFEPRIPLLVAAGVSSGMFTLPMLFMHGRPFKSVVFNSVLIWGWLIVGFNVGSPFLQSLGSQFFAHAAVTGMAGFALTAANLSFSQRRKNLDVLARRPIGRSQPRGLDAVLMAILKRTFVGGRTSTAQRSWNYPTRGESLFRWVRAAFQEMPLNTFVITHGTLIVVLAHPWMNGHAAGYPLGWYRPVFHPTSANGESLGSFTVMIMAMIAFSGVAAMLRSGQLYPISRRRRSAVAFVASNVAFALIFLGVVGGSVLAACLVALWSGLPLPPHAVAEFIVRMAMVVPFMPLTRGITLRLESSNSSVELLLFAGFVAIGVIVGQNCVLTSGLNVGIGRCLVSIAVSQSLYFVFLHYFYRHGDLLHRRTSRAATP